ncbi:MAG: precorrin-3B C(17)-methyltransferase, partial [Actinomycetota bacterium]
AELGAELKVYPARELEALNCPGSDFVNDSVGTPAVSEPAALLAAGEGAGLIAGKNAFERITVALAASPSMGKMAAAASPTTVNSESNSAFTNPDLGNSECDSPSGRVLVVGTGAGSMPLLTHEAAEAIRAADVVVGYRTYTEQLKLLFPGKEYISGLMGKEIERCRTALKQAEEGRTVALISSGDPGVYGMAGPVLEMANGIPVTVIPGVTAAQIAASRLGAPLMNDYVTLSLSDLLTPREEVLRRATAAAASDMVICLYNPSSKKRRPLFEEVCKILSRHRPGETPVGWLKDAGGPGEEGGVITLAELASQDVDMRTIIIVGNSKTAVVNGSMVTARGY